MNIQKWEKHIPVSYSVVLLGSILTNQSFFLAWEKIKKKVWVIILTHAAGAVLPTR